MKVVQEFEYPGYMSQDAVSFFQGKITRETRDGMAVTGSFVELASGKSHLPSKGDIFYKYENGSITVKTIHR